MSPTGFVSKKQPNPIPPERNPSDSLLAFPVAPAPTSESGGDEEAVRWAQVAQAAYRFVAAYHAAGDDPTRCGESFRVLEDVVAAFGRYLAGEEKPFPLPREAALLILAEWARRNRVPVKGGAIETPAAHFRVLQGKGGDPEITLVVDTPKVTTLRRRDRLQAVEIELARASAEAKAYQAAIEAGDDQPKLPRLRDAGRARVKELQAEANGLRALLDRSEALTLPLAADLSQVTLEVH